MVEHRKEWTTMRVKWLALPAVVIMAVVLGLARAFAAAGGLPRTLVFALFSGEEMGLLGSAHYVKHPALPLDRTVAMLNFDMVGRLGDGAVRVAGVDSAAGLRALVTGLASDGGLALTLRDSPYGPSDHTSFYSAGVPVLFFHTGSHADYHAPTDTADKIDAAGMARISALAARLVERMAGAPRPVYARVPPPASSGRGGSAAGGAFLGVAADRRDGGDGVRLATIIAGTAAAQAGLRDGDVLVRIGEVSVTSFEELRRVLGQRRPGDTVSLVYLRDGRDHAASTTLGARP